MSRHQNDDQIHDIRVDNKSFTNVQLQIFEKDWQFKTAYTKKLKKQIKFREFSS
jgi:hypothetical protein